MMNNGNGSAVWRSAALVTAFFAAVSASTDGAGAVEFQVLHSFTGGHDGGSPETALIADKAGPLYGTTAIGGSGRVGTVFKFAPPAAGHTEWVETILHSFVGGTAGNGTPKEGLTFDKAGNLYGAVASGSANFSGLIFELTPPATGQTAWGFHRLHSFPGNAGTEPIFGSMILDASGALYGTDYNYAFKLSPPTAGETTWHVTNLASLDRAYGSLLAGPGGVFYGTSSTGGAFFDGFAYELVPPAPGHTVWKETTLVDFDLATNAAAPYAGLIADSSGNLYGTTASSPSPAFAGTVYELSPPAMGHSSWQFTVLYTFQGGPHTRGTDGFELFAPVVFGATGDLYGTTYSGGNDTCSSVSQPVTLGFVVGGCGTVFRLTPPAAGQAAWTETVLYRFTGGDDGAYPVGGLLLRDGALYGTAGSGGKFRRGTLFKIVP